MIQKPFVHYRRTARLIDAQGTAVLCDVMLIKIVFFKITILFALCFACVSSNYHLKIYSPKQGNQSLWKSIKLLLSDASFHWSDINNLSLVKFHWPNEDTFSPTSMKEKRAFSAEAQFRISSFCFLNFMKISFVWDQSGTCSSIHQEKRANQSITI